MIRKYQNDDLKFILEIWESSSLIAHNFLRKDFFELERKNIIDLYLPNTKTYVYTENSIIMGFISLIGNEIGGLFVAPQYQRKNIGRQMIVFSKKLVGNLEVEVFEKNEIGKSFYYKNNFIFLRESMHKETGEKLLRLKQISNK